MNHNDLKCEECGRFGAREIFGRLLCDDCLILAGCGCGGQESDDEN